jgi:transposase
MQKIAQVDPKRLAFFDEFGSNLGMTRHYARAPSAERAYGKVPRNVGVSITLVLGLCLQGVVAPCAFQGPMNGHVFGLYMTEQVLPACPPDGIVVIDNLPAHHAEDVSDALEERGIVVVEDAEDLNALPAEGVRAAPGIQVWFLPPYSPELSPAEECGSKIKTLLRAKEARTTPALLDAMGDAIGQVTPQDAQGWFGHACRDRAPRPRHEATDHGGKGSAATSDQPRAEPSA